MRLLVLALLGLLFLAGCAQPPGNGVPPTDIAITGFNYVPQTLTIGVGDTVTWRNDDTVAHTVTGLGFDSGSIPPGGTYSYTFAQTGTFSYRCVFHPTLPEGSITVTGGTIPASPGGSPDTISTPPASQPPPPPPSNGDGNPPPGGGY
ncbi:MAG: cupredoxin domain-containing protein [Candidatus Diapherotrites archaeon]|nr:cupredoxin domain-containing protein [Candidatus Diapherotrites archaeon]MDZ4256575.1 cupredoxin domain-containing protein [archaeon]